MGQVVAATKTDEANMSEELDKVLHAQDRKLAVNQFFQEQLGSEPGQAELASRALAENFTLTGATLMFNGKLAKDAIDDVTAHLKRQKYDFLLPPEAPDLTRTAVDPKLLDRAFVHGSPDARTEVYKRVGRDQAKFDALARDYGLRDAKDYRKGVGVRPGTDNASGGEKRRTPNPFDPATRNYTEMGRLVRTNRMLAASLAASAGVDISGRPLR
jgi:hypothetical protein